MLSYWRYCAGSLAQSSKHAEYPLFLKIFVRSNQTPINFCSKSSYLTSDSDVVGVNMDTMMYGNDQSTSNCNNELEQHTIISMDKHDATVAPIDVNPWIDEELEKGGTVDMEYVEKDKEEIHYPEPPKERSGYYEFEGIKIWLPKKMLTPATYRYRLTEEEEQTLPDDIRICKFENFKPTP